MPTGAEKRRSVRHEALKQARVIAGQATIYCAIRDLSTTGAKLEVGSCSYFPPVFKSASDKAAYPWTPRSLGALRITSGSHLSSHSTTVNWTRSRSRRRCSPGGGKALRYSGNSDDRPAPAKRVGDSQILPAEVNRRVRTVAPAQGWPQRKNLPGGAG
jgi:hypothetical protein